MPRSKRLPLDSPQRVSSPRSLLLNGVASAAVAVAALATYWHATGYYFSQDDFIFLARAKGLQPYPGLLGPMGNRIISTRLYFEFMHNTFGLNAAPYHWASLLIHTLNAVLVYLLARCLTGARLPALVAGLLFATFDQAFTAVFWASGVQDLLATMFLLISALIWVSRQDKRAIVAGLSAVAFGLSMLCKEAGLLLPGVLWLMAWAQGVRRESALKALTPHFALSAIAIAGTVWQSSKIPKGGAYESGITADLFHNFATYVNWTVNVVSPFKDRVAIIDHNAWKSALVVAFLALLFLITSRGRQARMQWVSVGWYGLMIVPVLPLLRHTYLYYLYPALPGAAILVGLAAHRLTVSLAGRYRSRGRAACWALTLSATAVLCLLGSLNVRKRETTYLRQDIKLPHDHVLRGAFLAGNAASDFVNIPLPKGADLLLIAPFRDASVGGNDLSEGKLPGRPMTQVYPIPRSILNGLVLSILKPDLGEIDFADQMEPRWEDRHGVLYDALGKLYYLGTGADLWANLALVLMLDTEPDLEEAGRHSRRAMELDPMLPLANMAHGIVLARAGSDSLAAIHLRYVVTWASTGSMRASALEWLDKLKERQSAHQ